MLICKDQYFYTPKSDSNEMTTIFGQKEDSEVISSFKNQLTELQKQHLDTEFK